MTTSNITSDKLVLAINFTQEQMDLIKAAVKKEGSSGAHIGRVAVLTAAAGIMGVAVPEIVEGKKGPKGNKNAEAEKLGLSNAEYARRVKWHLDHGVTLAKLSKVDLTQDPSPRKPRAPKAEADVSQA